MNWLWWLRRPATARTLAGLTVLLVPLSLAARQNWFAAGGASIVLGVAFAVVGLVVAWHRPRNLIGWFMLALGRGVRGPADAVDLETVRMDLAGVVNRALEPTHVSVWTARDTRPG